MSKKPEFDLNTSAGGRGYIAQLFKDRLKRHDFTSYINERLAADFACVISQFIEGLLSNLASEVYKNTTSITRYNDELQGRLHVADELIRGAWRLMDGQRPDVAVWHLPASYYINNPTAAGVGIEAIGLLDTARLDLYERLHFQEAALVPYFDDSVGKWFIPPADDDQGDGQHFGTFRQAIDTLSQGGAKPDDQAPALQQHLETMAAQYAELEHRAADVVECLWGEQLPGAGNTRLLKLRQVLESITKTPAVQCNDCKGTGFCLSILGDDIRCPCGAPIQFTKPPADDSQSVQRRVDGLVGLLSAAVLPRLPAAAQTAAKPKTCATCSGEGVIHTGITESPTTTCNRCEGLGHE